MSVVYSNGLEISSIAPKHGEKYSPNLYAWLTDKKRKHRVWTSRVYVDGSGTLWIGHLEDDCFTGCSLVAVLCNGRKEASFADIRRSFVAGLKEVDNFWDRYIRVGRCAIDPGHKMHFVGDDARLNSDKTSCLWCERSLLGA